MLSATIFDILNQAQLDECHIKFRLVNKTPTVVIQFVKEGATANDNDKVQELRKALATPLFSQYQVTEEIDSLIIADLGHAVEELTDSVSAIVTEQSKQEKSKKAKPKPKKTTASGAQSAESASSVGKSSDDQVEQPEVDTTQIDPFKLDMSTFSV